MTNVEIKGKVILFSVACLFIVAIVAFLTISAKDSHLTSIFATDQQLESVAISADAQYIAAGGKEGEITVWNRTLASEPKRMYGHRGAVTDMAFSPDGRFLASGGQDGVTFLWSVDTAERVSINALLPQGNLNQNNSSNNRPNELLPGEVKLSFSPDSQTLVTTNVSGQIVVFDLNALKVKFIFEGHPVIDNPGYYYNILQVVVSPNNKMVGSIARDNKINIWDITTGKKISSFDVFGIGLPKSLLFSQDSQNIITIPSKADIQIWSIGQSKRIWSASIMSSNIPSAAVSFDARILAYGGATQAGTFFDGLPVIGNPDPIIYLSNLTNPAPTNQDGSCAIPPYPGANGFVSTPCPSTKPFATLRGHSNTVSDLAFSADGYWLVSSSWDKTVNLWFLQ